MPCSFQEARASLPSHFGPLLFAGGNHPSNGSTLRGFYALLTRVTRESLGLFVAYPSRYARKRKGSTGLSPTGRAVVDSHTQTPVDEI
ncbi:uncharacterized protein N7483_012416 [Penicillium malachiteum]|uniref:uncharacterized protein n=1 Tax=Penicillium malachiteum TaxID=1324776 RepID=UPI0025486D36|nr:uncharacterized protein N7483_012416 [Penicillium malachiteum]KAJ5715235.1 hypothetical protein N7483_012416 [Penicillium malachiteum]